MRRIKYTLRCILATLVVFIMLANCSRAGSREDEQRLWLGFGLTGTLLEPTYPAFDGNRSDTIERIRRRSLEQLEDPEAELERQFLLAMGDLLSGNLLGAVQEFDRMARDGYSKARLLSRLTLLSAQTLSVLVTDLLMATLVQHIGENYSLNVSELINLVKADARSATPGFTRTTPSATVIPAFLDDQPIPENVRESIWYQQGVESRVKSTYANRPVDESLWLRRGRDRPDLSVMNLTDEQVQQIDALPDRMDTWLVKILVFSHPLRFNEQRLLQYLTLGPELLGREGDRYNRSWMARVVSEALAATQATPNDLVADLLDAFEIREYRAGMLDLAVVEARFGNNAAATDILVNLIDDSIVHGIDELPSAAADAKPDLVYLLSAVYVIYPDFDGLVDSGFGTEIAVAFARALERTRWHVAR